MESLINRPFYKHRTCPPSAILLSYSEGDLVSDQIISVSKHLSGCDFCCAELQLLSHFTLDTADYQVGELPANLKSLAEALLTRSAMAIESFVVTSLEKEPLTLTDA